MIIEAKKKTQLYAKRSTIAVLFDYKNPSDLLKSFREYADAHPLAFGAYKPYIKNRGMDTLYNIICFAYFFENKDLLEAETRSISFKSEVTRLKEVWG